ncbi:TetR/AcrR family transcriptional regulator [Streptomyces johnsoniae]|uniref:TetR/AcrR family transcriptional regulator n=1 Tax=Streptomyces johnsoniae TaxID=3075532 RepID=A0ABU2S7B9_9ACTN|nr:TetR/AcrR family transcriptional regulator [Streptomyces sp. DSM 41886]MDT0444882.1 TetR/AcrR family transcriptional regulator [Streptomyces sp. DSM 41886]
MPICAQCAREFTRLSRGRAPRYCSRACQARAYRARKAGPPKAEPANAPPAAAPPRTGRPPAGPGRSSGTLSVLAIVRAAVRIADSEGLDALSMRRVADSLGAGAMALYHYVTGKDELIELMVGQVYADSGAAAPPGPGGWRAALEHVARAEWALYTAHPWTLRVLATVRPPLAPSVLAGAERAMAALDGTGVDSLTVHRLTQSVLGQVQGLGLLRVSEIEAARRAGPSLAHWRTVTAPAVLMPDRDTPYPRLASTARDAEAAADLDALFEFGLARILDGVALFLDGLPDRTEHTEHTDQASDTAHGGAARPAAQDPRAGGDGPAVHRNVADPTARGR